MKQVLILFLVCFITTLGYSQNPKLRRFEGWAGVSVFQYFGDIGGSADENNLMGLKDISIKSNRPGISFGATFKVNDIIYLNVSNSLGLFAQTDKGSRNSTRDFAFSTIANETTIQGQYFFIKEKDNYFFSMMSLRGGSKNIYRCFSFYAYAGAGSIYFKVTPKESFIGSPRFSDDQSISFAFPIGFGLKIAYTPLLSLGVDFGGRFTLTDKLDGLASKFSKHNDIYYIMNFKIIYRLPKYIKIRHTYP